MLFSTNEIMFSYSDAVILENISVTFEDRDRIGFIGANGAGKTTFLRVILGELQPDKGSVYKKNGLSIGYLKQNAGLDSDKTVKEEMLDAFSDVLEVERRMREIEGELGNIDPSSKEYKILTSEHKRLDDYHTAREGYDMERKIKSVLFGMGFANDFDKSIGVMSGGERTRLALSKLLLSNLDLLILDEPTNHLDVQTMQWLEKYLNESYKGALLIVSHDRYFLDKTISKIWELEGKDIYEYRANYTNYKELKRIRLLSQQRAYDRQQEQISEMLDYAQRNICRATTSKSAKSRIHRVEGMELVEKPLPKPKTPIFRFSILNECNKNVITVENLCLKAGDYELIPALSFSAFNKERIAIVGANGIGKSTLIKTLIGLENNETDRYNPVPELQSSGIFEGFKKDRQCNAHIKYGKNLRISYYDQENINLIPSNSVLEEFWYRFPLMPQSEARAYLARLLFTPEDMSKRVSSLSGGERAKLAFAIVTAEKSNLLILDEPTNHLDLASREALEKGLKEFEGTVLFVSHDRYFINAVATNVLELSKEGGTSYKGSFDSYLALKQEELQKEKEREQLRIKEESTPPQQKVNSGFRTKEDRRKTAQRAERIRELEKLIESTEQEIADLNDRIINGKEYAIMKELYATLTEKQELLEKYYEEWSSLI